LWRLVVLQVLINVSKERITSIFRMCGNIFKTIR
jgi:hypothetical protein